MAPAAVVGAVVALDLAAALVAVLPAVLPELVAAVHLLVAVKPQLAHLVVEVQLLPKLQLVVVAVVAVVLVQGLVASESLRSR